MYIFSSLCWFLSGKYVRFLVIMFIFGCKGFNKIDRLVVYCGLKYEKLKFLRLFVSILYVVVWSCYVIKLIFIFNCVYNDLLLKCLE